MLLTLDALSNAIKITKSTAFISEKLEVNLLPGGTAGCPKFRSDEGTPKQQPLITPPSTSNVARQAERPQSQSFAVPSLDTDTMLRPLSTIAKSKIPEQSTQMEPKEQHKWKLHKRTKISNENIIQMKI